MSKCVLFKFGKASKIVKTQLSMLRSLQRSAESQITQFIQTLRQSLCKTQRVFKLLDLLSSYCTYGLFPLCICFGDEEFISTSFDTSFDQYLDCILFYVSLANISCCSLISVCCLRSLILSLRDFHQMLICQTTNFSKPQVNRLLIPIITQADSLKVIVTFCSKSRSHVTKLSEDKVRQALNMNRIERLIVNGIFVNSGYLKGLEIEKTIHTTRY